MSGLTAYAVQFFTSSYARGLCAQLTPHDYAISQNRSIILTV